MIKNKKAVVISLDAALAVVLMITIVSLAYANVAKTQSTLPYTAMNRLGSDIITVMDEENLLSQMSASTLQTKINLLLPETYNMKIKLECDGSESAETTAALPANKFIGSGKLYFVKRSSSTIQDRCKATWWIWQKQA